jgi:NAD(P)H-nitrite reductase large subunit
MIVDAIENEDACTSPDIKKATTADNGCDGCVLLTGFIPKILKTSPNSPFTRAELFEIIRVKELKRPTASLSGR